MRFLDRLLGRRETQPVREAEPPQEVEPRQPECPHVILVPNWDMAEDTGDLEKVSRYTCEACGAGFSREEGDQLRAKEGERKEDKISQLAAMERERQRRSERDR